MPSNHTGSGEGRLRRELADCCRLFADLGWGEAIFNHIAAREDARCVMQLGTTAAMAVSGKEVGRSHDNFYGAMVRRMRGRRANARTPRKETP